MAYKAVELTERRDYFHIVGNSDLILDREDGCSSGIFHELKEEVYIPGKLVSGHRLFGLMDSGLKAHQHQAIYRLKALAQVNTSGLMTS